MTRDLRSYTGQIAPDTQTALALVSAEVGCHLTFASVARNATDPHIVFVPLEERRRLTSMWTFAPHSGVTTEHRRFTRSWIACSPPIRH